MSIRAQLQILLLVFMVCAGTTAAYMGRVAIVSQHNSRVVSSLVNEMKAAMEVRRSVNGQMLVAMEYASNANAESLATYRRLESETWESFGRWEAGARATGALSGTGGSQSMEIVRTLWSAYEIGNAAIENLLAMEDLVSDAEALERVEEEVDDFVDGGLFPAIDGVIETKWMELNSRYDQVLVNLGATPWAVAAGRHHLGMARAAAAEFVLSSRAHSAAIRLTKETLDALLSTGVEGIEELNSAMGTMEESARQWALALERFDALVEEEAMTTEHELHFNYDASAEIQTLGLLVEECIALKNAGKHVEALSLYETKLAPFAH
jgi:hypothetical protein